MRSLFSFCVIVLTMAQTPVKAQPCTLAIVPTSYMVCPGYQATITAFGANSYTWTGTTFTTPVLNQSVAVGPGTYTVSGNNNACQATITILLAPPLSINISRSSATTCIQSNSPLLSKPVILTASGAGSYTWYPLPSFPTPTSQVTVRPSTSTCYTVVGTSAACSGSAQVCVTVVPQFTIALTPVQSSVCAGDPAVLSVSVGAGATGPASGFSYRWQNADTTMYADNPLAIEGPLGTTVYTITVSDTDNCISAPATASITVDPCTNIPDRKTHKTAIYPNPFDDFLNIGLSDAVLLEIADAAGRTIMVIKPGAEKRCRVGTSELLPGVYFVTVTDSGLRKTVVKVIRN